GDGRAPAEDPLSRRQAVSPAARRRRIAFCWMEQEQRAHSPRLRVVLDTAIERIGGQNLPRIRQDHQAIRLRCSEIDGADRGEAVEDERQASTSEKIGLIGETEMQVGPSEGPVFPILPRGRVRANSVWVAAARASASILMSSFPAGSSTA